MQQLDAQGRKLRLNKRMSVGFINGVVISIPAGSTTNFSMFASASAAQQAACSFPLMQTQAFRVIEGNALVADDATPASGHLTLVTPNFVFLDPGNIVDIYGTMLPLMPFTLSNRGVSWYHDVSPLIFNSDYANLLPQPFISVMLDVRGAIINNDAVNAHPIFLLAHAIIEIFDVEPLGGSA